MCAEHDCPAIFVTGTDTGVGKTMATAALARFFSRRGLSVGVMKPCETGVADPNLPGEDARLLLWAAASRDDINLVAPYRLKTAAAPSLAAEREGVVIDAQRIVDSFTEIRKGKDLVLIEGAGGLMVPLRGGFLTADLVGQLGSRLLVVARPALGTINHTLLTIFAARTMELPLAGFLINRMPAQPNVAEEDAPHQLAKLASADLLGVLPDVAGSTEARIEQLAEVIATLPTLPWLLRAFGLPPRI